MITRLSLKNFKAFEDETFCLGRLNILAGLNNSGKSSVIQAIRLAAEQKPLTDLGPLREYIRSDFKSDSRGFDIECHLGEGQCQEDFRFSLMRDSKNPIGGKTMSGIISYISADRFGPRNSLPLNINGDTTTAGSKGENIVDFLSRLDNDWVELRLPEKLSVSGGTGIKDNIQEWLRVVSPGVRFDWKPYKEIDIGRTEFNGHRPVHVGFGLSYALPIIASVLIHTAQLSCRKEESALLLVENPEAHLHPSGQTKMGELLARAASCGLQIVVETHSDHLLNGVRIAVKEGLLSHTEVKLFFFKADNSGVPATVERVFIDKHGMLDYWPDGFFDETEKSLMRLV